jgi:hypothetical protein
MSDVPQQNPSLLAQLRDLPAFAISFGLHIVALTLLAGITFHTEIMQEMTMMSSMVEDEDVQLEEYKFAPIVTDQVGNDSNLNQLGPSVAMAQKNSINPQVKMEQQLQEEIVDIKIPQSSVMAPPSTAELTAVVDVAGETEHAGGTAGAVDRLTFEIASSLKQNPTLVIWLFDASLSLEKRRLDISNRFENINKQLRVMNSAKNNPLKTAVVSFGQDVKLLTEKPVDDYQEAVKLVKEIKSDSSGQEKVFTAVDMATNQWARGAARAGMKIMMVIVTDERGDDIDLLETVIGNCKKYRIKTYCLGNASVFGKEIGYVSFTWKEGNYSYTEDRPVHSGPESAFPEQLSLGFWGNIKNDLTRLSAAYGPYGLTRLCAETGGLYIIMEDVSNGKTFDFSIMRNYPPDYRPLSIVGTEISKNMAKKSLLEAVRLTEVGQIPIPTLTFRADNDTALRQEITEAQKPVAEMEYKLNEVLNTLKQGESARKTLREARWRASYDLAMGRTLAMLTRFYGYNAMVAEMKVAPQSFKKPGSNQWRLVPSTNIGGGIAVRKMSEEALTYLKRVTTEHQGTPWELIAQQELSQPLGWEWQEGTMYIPKMNQMNQMEMPRFADDEEKKMKMNTPPPPKAKPNL